MTELIFSHSGNMGDILFSLHFVKEVIGWKRPEKAYFVLTYGRPAVYLQGHPDGDVQMSRRSAEFIKPLLEQSGMFREVQIVDYSKFAALRGRIGDCVDLDEFRAKKLSFMGGDIRNWYYSLSNMHFKRDFSEDLFKGKFEGDCRAKGKVLVTCTERVNNYYIDISLCLCNHRDSVAFIGLDEEHRRIERLLGYGIPRIEVKDMEDAAYLMRGSKGVIGTQGGLYSLAEMLKVPRVLIPPQYILHNGQLMYGPCNNHPIGGECDLVQTIEQAVHLPDFLFK